MFAKPVRSGFGTIVSLLHGEEEYDPHPSSFVLDLEQLCWHREDAAG